MMPKNDTEVAAPISTPYSGITYGCPVPALLRDKVITQIGPSKFRSLEDFTVQVVHRTRAAVPDWVNWMQLPDYIKKSFLYLATPIVFTAKVGDCFVSLAPKLSDEVHPVYFVDINEEVAP